MKKTVFDKVAIIVSGVRYRARKRFRQENLVNPYGNFHLLKDYVQKGMAEVYDDEIKGLIDEKICPCCGQPTRGDLDY